MSANTQVYLIAGDRDPREDHPTGRPDSQLRVLNQTHLRADRVGAEPDTHWQRLFIRYNERGVLKTTSPPGGMDLEEGRARLAKNGSLCGSNATGITPTC
jgi:hypothetical protein